MATMMAFLRGINVGGNHIIKMADLKRTLEKVGFRNVQTYIQSGNVLFDAADEDALVLEARIERTLAETYGFPVPTMIRSAAEMADIARRCPYAFEGLAEGQSIHLNLLKAEPTQDELSAIPPLDTGADTFKVDGREIYLYYGRSMLDSPLPKKLQKIGPVTSRNWKTILKMIELAKARE